MNVKNILSTNTVRLVFTVAVVLAPMLTVKPAMAKLNYVEDACAGICEEKCDKVHYDALATRLLNVIGF